jgi:YggT family protein
MRKTDEIIHFLTRLFSLLIIIDVVMGYFLSPYHPLRQPLDRLILPLLTPIRKFVPTVGILDFSSLILLILVQISDMVLTNLLLSIR